MCKQNVHEHTKCSALRYYPPAGAWSARHECVYSGDSRVLPLRPTPDDVGTSGRGGLNISTCAQTQFIIEKAQLTCTLPPNKLKHTRIRRVAAIPLKRSLVFATCAQKCVHALSGHIIIHTRTPSSAVTSCRAYRINYYCIILAWLYRYNCNIFNVASNNKLIYIKYSV